jgi:hypothetical protein
LNVMGTSDNDDDWGMVVRLVKGGRLGARR